MASAGKNFKIRMPYKTRQFYSSSKKVPADKIAEKCYAAENESWIFNGFTDGKVVYTSL